MKYLLSLLCLFLFSCAEQEEEEEEAVYNKGDGDSELIIQINTDYENGKLELEKNEQWCNEHKTYHDISKEKYPCLKPKPY